MPAKKITFLIISIIGVILLFVLIFNKELLPKNAPAPANSIAVQPTPGPEPIIEPQPKEIVGEYYLYVISETDTVTKLKKDLSKEDFETMLALNHIDQKFVGQGTKLVVPKNFLTNQLDYSPFPKKIDLLQNIPKIILISQKVQYIGVYENGMLIYSAPVSTGKKSTQTPNGLFNANWKAKKTISTIDDAWVLPWYINLDNFDGISMHQYELPGYPASHSCIRMREVDAKWVYDFVDQWQLSDNGQDIIKKGTPVILFGDYAYDKQRPWLNLVDDPYYLAISEEVINQELQKTSFQQSVF